MVGDAERDVGLQPRAAAREHDDDWSGRRCATTRAMVCGVLTGEEGEDLLRVGLVQELERLVHRRGATPPRTSPAPVGAQGALQQGLGEVQPTAPAAQRAPASIVELLQDDVGDLRPEPERSRRISAVSSSISARRRPASTFAQRSWPSCTSEDRRLAHAAHARDLSSVNATGSGPPVGEPAAEQFRDFLGLAVDECHDLVRGRPRPPGRVGSRVLLRAPPASPPARAP